MQRPIIAIVLGAALTLGGCSPVFDWREARFPPSPLKALFPCKPERETRTVFLASQPLDLHMASCRTAGMTTAVGFVTLAGPELLGVALEQWREATLKAMGARDVSLRPFVVAGASTTPAPSAVHAQGTVPSGGSLVLDAVWFAQGRTGFVAMMFGEQAPGEILETFQAGLKLQ